MGTDSRQELSRAVDKHQEGEGVEDPPYDEVHHDLGNTSHHMTAYVMAASAIPSVQFLPVHSSTFLGAFLGTCVRIFRSAFHMPVSQRYALEPTSTR